MANRTIVASAPHIHGSLSTTRLMGDVIIALLPALAVSVYVYGWGVLGITAMSIACCAQAFIYPSLNSLLSLTWLVFFFFNTGHLVTGKLNLFTRDLSWIHLFLGRYSHNWGQSA